MRSSSSVACPLISVATALLCACSPNQAELLAQQQLAQKQLAQKQYELQRQDYLNSLERYNQWKSQQEQRCFEKVTSDIRYATEQQRLLNEQVQNGCCEVKTVEEPYRDFGLEFRPQCAVPPPPQPPTPPSE